MVLYSKQSSNVAFCLIPNTRRNHRTLVVLLVLPPAGGGGGGGGGPPVAPPPVGGGGGSTAEVTGGGGGGMRTPFIAASEEELVIFCVIFRVFRRILITRTSVTLPCLSAYAPFLGCFRDNTYYAVISAMCIWTFLIYSE
jgi:hypothetical protein